MPQMDEFEVLSFSRLNHVTMSVTQIGYRNPHIHQALEICLVLEGEADVWARDHVFHTGEGAILLFSPGEPHEISSTDPQGVRIAYIQIATCVRCCTGFSRSCPTAISMRRRIRRTAKKWRASSASPSIWTRTAPSA